LLPESEKPLCRAAEVLDVATVVTPVPPEFGETQLRTICIKFDLCFSEAKNAYRDFKESAGTVVTDSLKKVLNLIDTIPVSTAECERGFSRMNLVCNSLMSRLSVKHMSSLMFIGLSGPPLALGNHYPLSSLGWLSTNERRPSKTKILEPENPKHLSLWHAM